jgi:hypothetical protein
MLLAYADESYTKSRYWIAAVLCPEDVVFPLTMALDAVVEKAAKAYGTRTGAELHGHPLFQGQDDWASLLTKPRARIGIYNDAFDAIAGFDVEIIIRGVDILGLKTRYKQSAEHPHAVVLERLLERIDDRAKQRDQLALLIADQVDGADEYRRHLWFFQRFMTAGYRARQITRVVDTIHFAPSTASRLVQAADLVAYLKMRIDSKRDLDERALRRTRRSGSGSDPRSSTTAAGIPWPGSETHEGPAGAGPKAHRRSL